MMITDFRRCLTIVVACTALAAGSRVADAQTIDTRTGESSAGSIATGFGQSFTAPAGASTLQQFSFWIASGGSDLMTSYEAFVMQWNGSAPFGEVLYSSGPLDTPICCPLMRVDFDTGDLAVTPGSEYIAFLLRTSGNITYSRVRLGGEWFDSYAGGAALFAHSCGDDESTFLETCSWNESGVADIDTEFVATFASVATVPEPNELALVMTGVIGLIGLQRGRRRA